MKLINSFGYALQGLMHCVKNERNFRIHITSASTVALLAIFYNVPPHQAVLLVFTIVFVFVTEMVNTSIERTVDLLTKEHSPNARIAKDVAAGAVLVSAVCSVVIGFIVFFDIPKIKELFTALTSSPTNIIIVICYMVICIMFIGRNNKHG